MGLFKLYLVETGHHVLAEQINMIRCVWLILSGARYTTDICLCTARHVPAGRFQGTYLAAGGILTGILTGDIQPDPIPSY